MSDREGLASTRSEAIAAGDRFYKTGGECKSGHISKRRTSNGRCVECESQQSAEWAQLNPEKIKKIRLSSYRKNSEARRAYQSIAREKNPDYYKEKNKQWYRKNKEKKKAYNKNYRLDNRDKINFYVRGKRKSDPIFSLSDRMRARIQKAFMRGGFSKGSKTETLVGCSWQELKVHIERQFTKGMSWENRSEWHIDHIVPLASAKTKEDIIALSHYTNLRPMWAKENFSKGALRGYLI